MVLIYKHIIEFTCDYKDQVVSYLFQHLGTHFSISPSVSKNTVERHTANVFNKMNNNLSPSSVYRRLFSKTTTLSYKLFRCFNLSTSLINLGGKQQKGISCWNTRQISDTSVWILRQTIMILEDIVIEILCQKLVQESDTRLIRYTL